MAFLTGMRKGKRRSHTRREGAEYAAINLCAHGDKFSHMQKYFFVYAKIYFHIYGNFPAHIRKFIGVYTEVLPAYRAGSPQALPAPSQLPYLGKSIGISSLRTGLAVTSARKARCSTNDSIFAQ